MLGGLGLPRAPHRLLLLVHACSLACSGSSSLGTSSLLGWLWLLGFRAWLEVGGGSPLATGLGGGDLGGGGGGGGGAVFLIVIVIVIVTGEGSGGSSNLTSGVDGGIGGVGGGGGVGGRGGGDGGRGGSGLA